MSYNLLSNRNSFVSLLALAGAIATSLPALYFLQTLYISIGEEELLP